MQATSGVGHTRPVSRPGVAWRALLRREYLLTIRSWRKIGTVLGMSLVLALLAMFAPVVTGRSVSEVRAAIILSVFTAIGGMIVFNLSPRIYVDTDTAMGVLWQRSGQPLWAVLLVKFVVEAVLTAFAAVPLGVLLVLRHVAVVPGPLVALTLLGSLAAMMTATAAFAAAVGKQNNRIVYYGMFYPMILVGYLVRLGFGPGGLLLAGAVVYPPLAAVQGMAQWVTGVASSPLLASLLWTQAFVYGALSTVAVRWRIKKLVLGNGDS